jgi:hypothetical protein
VPWPRLVQLVDNEMNNNEMDMQRDAVSGGCRVSVKERSVVDQVLLAH